MAHEPFENLRVYRMAEELADAVWDVITGWDGLARDTVGKQLVRAADSVGANIAEGAGRGSFQDNKRFIKIARGSLNEARHFLRRAHKRKLLASEDTKRLKALVDALPRTLNAYLKSVGRAQDSSKDE